MTAWLLAVWLPGAQASGAAPVVLGDSIKPVAVAPASGPVKLRRPYISRATLKAGEATAMMTFEVALKMRNFADLQARVDKGEHVSSQEMVAKYEPLATDYQAAVDWLTSQGFTIVRQDSHHMAIFVRGNVNQIAQALKVNFARVTSEGKEYTSAVTAPSMPANIASLLVGVNGLQPHLHAHSHIAHPNAGSGTASYTPSQIAQAYQASGLYSANITGSGQTIAIVIDTFPSTGDLISFWQTYGVNQSIGNIQFIQAVAGTLPVPSGEETLDTEWSSSIAPGAKVRVYAATDLGSADLDAAYQQVYDDVTAHPELEIHQMSMSYGEGEIETTDSQMATDHQYFVELTNAGVTCFAATGDEGSTPGVDAQGNPNENGFLEVESPASDPDVIGVGGTSLTDYANPTAGNEVVWNDGASGGATGGGVSGYFPNPGWQKTPAGVSLGTMRLVPDISCAADPNYGADTIFAGTPGPLGGTSWACPTCAAFCALINQARANVGRASIGQMGPLIYPLIGTANFRDITSGNNATAISGGLYSATTGYDECTGIGVPLVQTLAETLANSQTLFGVSVPAAAQTVGPGQNATFTVAAGGSPAGYQWQQMPLGATTWSNLSDSGAYSGSATASLTVTNATTAMSGDRFQCLVSYSGAGALTSAPACVLIVETPWIISTLAGTAGVAGLTTNATGTAAEFDYPTGIAVDNSGNLYVTDLINNEIRKVTPAGAVTTPYGSLTGASGSTNSTGNNALFNSPRDIAIDSSNNLYVADEGNNLIRKITRSTGQVSTIGGSTAFKAPRGIAVDSLGNVYVSDSDNNVIRKIATNGTVRILAGSSSFTAGYKDGAATTQALFNQPIGIAVDSSENVYVADYGNAVVRKITSAGVVSTVGGEATLAGQVGFAGYLDGDGPGSQSLFNVPRGVAVDRAGNLYVTDSYAPIVNPPPEFSGNNLLRKITPAGVVSTLAGQAGVAGSTDAIGTAAQFYNPCGVAIDSSGNLYVADAGNNTIRAGVAEPIVSVSATLPYAAVNGPIAGQFTVTRTGSTLASLAVNYSVGGTAVSNTDYSALPGSVTIPAGASSATITVNPLSNPQTTANLTLQLTLTSSIAGVLIDPVPATMTISEAKPVMFGAWEASFPNPLTGASAALLATPWNDGIPNLLKYVFDIDPSVPMTSADRAALPTVGAATIGETSYLTLTYREYAGLTGITVNAQTSPDLQTWTTVMNPTIFVTGIDPATGDPIMQVQVAGTSGFIRLSVVSP